MSPCPSLLLHPWRNDSSDSIIKQQIAMMVKPCFAFDSETGEMYRSVNRRRIASAIAFRSSLPTARL